MDRGARNGLVLCRTCGTPPSHNNFLPALVYRAASRSGSGSKEEIARLVETLALASVGKSTQRSYLGKWNIWVKERNAQVKGRWLHALANQDLVLAEVLEFMACRCFRAQQPTVHGKGVIGGD